MSSEDAYHSHGFLHTGEMQWEEAGGLTVMQHRLCSMPIIQITHFDTYGPWEVYLTLHLTEVRLTEVK